MNVLNIELNASEDLLVLVPQPSLDRVPLIGGHVLAVPIPVNGPGAGLSRENGAATGHVVASNRQIRREFDGLIQDGLVVEDQVPGGAEGRDLVG